MVPAHQCCPHKWPKPVCCCCCCCGKSILTWDHRESEWAHAPVPPAGDATTHRGTTNLELQLQQAFYTDNSQWRTVHITDTFINTDQCFFSWQFYYSFSFRLVNKNSRICIVVVTMMKVMYFLSKDIFVLITIEHRICTHCDKID